MKIIQGKFKILSQQKTGQDCFKVTILAPEIARQARPGQFAHLRCQDGPEPLLRRPLSFHRIYPDRFEVLYRVAGRGTALLSKKQKGDTIDVIGPLGNGFMFPSASRQKGRAAVLVAGGMGAAPLFALAERLIQTNEGKNIIVLLGAKTKAELLCEQAFKKLGCVVRVATDDGAKGRAGFVTELLQEVIQSIIGTGDKPVPITKASDDAVVGSRFKVQGNTPFTLQPSTLNGCEAALTPVPAGIYVCGPQPMVKEVARISAEFGVPAQGALEENMACGVGACLGCAVETFQGYKRVCKDGPVFDLSVIKW